MKRSRAREMFGVEERVLLDTVRRLSRRGAVAHLLKLVKKSHPAEMAAIFRHLRPDERKKLFNIIGQTENAAEFLSELDEALVVELVEDLSPQYLVSIFSEMDSDDLADLLDALPEESAARIRQHMEKKDRDAVDALLQYHPETAGGIMSPDFMYLDQDLTVGDAIAKVQERSEEKEMVFYLYITHGAKQLAGVLSLRELLLHPPYRKLKNIMGTKVISVATGTDQEEVAHIISQYNFLALPVVDENYTLVGIVTVDDIIDVIREEATEDFLQMAGAGKDREILLKSTVQNAMARAPWLFASWLGGLAVMVVVTLFESSLRQVIALAAFMPIVMGMGGNAGTQSSTIVVRGIATGRVNMQEIGKLILQQARVGILLGLGFGVLLGLVAMVSHHEIVKIGLVVALSLLCNMTLATTVGTFMPLILRRMDVDPAVSTGPFVTTAMDITGVTVYFLVANFLLHL